MSAAVHKIAPGEYAKKEGIYLRRIIRRNKGEILTNSEVKVLVAMLNLWLYHRHGPKKYIHPGRKFIAKRAGVTVITVSRSLDLFRTIGIANAINHIKGGNGRATQYTLNTSEIQALFDPHNVITISGELVPFSVSFASQNDTQQPYQNDTLSKGIVRNVKLRGSASFEGGDHE